VRKTRIAVWTALCSLSVALCAGGPERHEPPAIERIFERHADRLHLDDATREKIRALAADGREASQPQRDALRDLHDQLHALLSNDAPDADAVMAKAEEIGRAETELKKQRLRTMLAIRALLSTDQRRELVRIHEEFRARCRESGGRDPGCWRDRGERE
jgi:Spy/CpxP family protein refolding chaperone